MSHKIKRVVIEIGTNTHPEFASYVQENEDVFFIGVEPIPSNYREMIATIRNITDRMLAVRAVVAPGNGYTTLNISTSPRCSSLLESPGEGISKCAQMKTQIRVHKVSLDSLVRMVPPALSISIISIDAQGYDLVVASTLTLETLKVNPPRVLVLECQDLRENSDVRWLYKGARNCDSIRRCIESSQRWGKYYLLEACKNNHPDWDPKGRLMSEYNCFYRRVDVPSSEVDQYSNCSAARLCRLPRIPGTDCSL
eukprot:PhF_6_TR13437/c0_g1_i1/m.21457